MLLMATSPGARGGANVLEIAKKAFPLWRECKSYFSLPSFEANFDTKNVFRTLNWIIS
jgi:hypothetical protein